MLRFSPVFGLSRSVAHVSFHFLHVIFPRGGFRFGEFIRCMPKSRTMRQPPAVPNHAQDAGSLPTVSFLRGFIHACLLTVSARTFPPVLCFLFFPICIFIIIFSFLYFLICASLPALFRSLFSTRSFPLVLFRPRFPACTFLSALSRLYFPNCSFLSAFSFPRFPIRSFPPALSFPLFPACASLSIPSHSVIVPSSLFQPFRSFIRTETL